MQLQKIMQCKYNAITENIKKKNWRFAVKGEYNYTLNPLINLVKEIVMKTLAPTPPTEFKEILRRLYPGYVVKTSC